MAQRRQPRTAILILLTLLLVLPTIGGVGEGPVTLPVDTYYLGEPVAFSIAPAMAGNVTIRVTDGVHLYRFRSGEPVFTPIQAGEHNVTVRNEAGETLQQFSFMVLPVPIWLEKDVYTVGEPVAVRLNLTPGHDYALSIAVGGVEFQFAGGAQESVSFTPTQPGSHTIQLDDLTAVESYRKSFDVEQVPAVGPAQQGLFSPDEIRAALQRRFPSLEVGEVRYDAGRRTHDVTVRRLKDSVALRGVKDVANISAFEFVENRSLLRGLATDVVTVEGAAVDNATIRLAKYGPVEAIGRCDDFDAATGSCSAWIRTDIPFQDYGDYIEFTVSHFTGYGGLSQTNLYNVTSLSNTRYPNLSTTRDGTSNSYTTASIGAGTWSVINASTPSIVSAMIIRTTDVINFSANWTHTGIASRYAYVTYKFWYGNATTPQTEVCNFGSDSSAGYNLTIVGQQTAIGGCKPSTDKTIPAGSTLWLIVDLYKTVTTAVTYTIYWDGTYPTWMNVSSYQMPDINVTTNATTYTNGSTVNASGTFYWTNGSGIGSKNVTVLFLNTTSGVNQTVNVTTDASGNYWANYTLPSDAALGTWKVNATALYNATINATNQMTFQVVVFGTLNVSLSAPPDNTGVNPNATFSLNATVTCSGLTGALCGNITATARYNKSSATPDTAINATLGGTPFWMYMPVQSNGTQVWKKVNQRTEATQGFSATMDSQDNFLVTGFCWGGCGSLGGEAFHTAKWDANGNQVLNFTTDFTATQDRAHGVTTDSQNNIIVGGWCDACTTNPNATYSLALVRYNSSGSQLWNTTLGIGTGTVDASVGLATDTSKNIFVATSREYTGGATRDIFITKYNSSGSQLWNTTIGISGQYYEGRGVVVDSQGNVIVAARCGACSATGNAAFLTLKYNSSGSQLWNSTWGPANVNCEPYGIALDREGNIIEAGQRDTVSTGLAWATVKLNSAGVELWNVTEDYGSLDDIAHAVTVDHQDNIIVTGDIAMNATMVEYYTVAYSKTGSQLWKKSSNTTDGIYEQSFGVVADSLNNVYVGGLCLSCGVTSDNAMRTVKYTGPGINQLNYPGLTSGQSWNVSWVVNATGATNTQYYVDALFNSSYAQVASNDTPDAKVCIGTCLSAPVIANARINASSPVIINTAVRVNASVTNSSPLDTVKLQVAPPTGAAYNTTPSQSGSEYYNASVVLNQTGQWVFTFFANDSTGRNATPTAAQDGLSNAYINVIAFGTLNVSLSAPPDNTGVSPNATFYLNATITCDGITGAVCGNITATARYNKSGATPDTAINTTTGATPLYIAGGVAGLKSYDFNGITNPASPVNATYYTSDLGGIPPLCTDGYCEGWEFVNNTGSTDTAYQDVYANDTNYTYTYSATSASIPCVASENYHFRIAETNTPNLTLVWSGSHSTYCSASTTNNFTILMWNFTLGDWDPLYNLVNTSETDALKHLDVTKASPYIGNSGDVHVFVRLMRNGCAGPATCNLSSNYINLTVQGSGASNPQTNTSSLTQGQSWNVSWLVNATGANNTQYYVDALFNSSYASITSNDTLDARVCTGGCPLLGSLNVSLSAPPNNTGVHQNLSFYLNATVTCDGAPGTTCGNITATARYNGSSASPDAALNFSAGATPFRLMATTPVQVAYVTNSTSLNGSQSVFVSGSYAYVASYSGNSLTVFNVSTPSNPVQVAYVTNTTSLNWPESVFVSGSYAYIVTAGASLTVFDVSTPSNPVQVAYVTNGTSLSFAVSVFVSGSYAYVASYSGNSLTVFNVSTPSNPVQVAYVTNTTSLNSPRVVFVSGSHAYIASFNGNSLTVFDVPQENPAANPLALLSGQSWNVSWLVTLTGGACYEVDTLFNSSSAGITSNDTADATVCADYSPIISSARINASSPANINTTVKVNASITNSSPLDKVFLQIAPPTGAAFNTTPSQSGSQFYNASIVLNQTGQWTFTFFANDSLGLNATPMLANDSLGNQYINVLVLGVLNVSLPAPQNNTGVNQNSTFYLNATITCSGAAGAVCGNITATARYNKSSSSADTAINTTSGGTPFWTSANPQANTSGLTQDQAWNVTFTVNLTGSACYKVDALFNSSYSTIPGNHTADATVCAALPPVISKARINASSPAFINTTVRVNASVVDQNGDLANVTLQVAPPTGAAYNTTPSQNGSQFYNASVVLNQTGTWVFTFFANDSLGLNATPMLANDSLGNQYINVTTPGTLNVNLTAPSGDISVNQSNAFYLNATVTCGGLTGAVCGDITATARYNASSSSPDTALNTTVGSVPFSIVSPLAAAQLWNLTAPAGYWDISTGVAVDNQSNIVLTGYCNSCGALGSYALYTAEYNSSGSQRWNATNDPTGSWDYANGVAVDGQGNVVVTGWCDGCGAKGSYALYTVKYNSSGSQLWNVSTDPTTSLDTAYAVAVDNQSNIVVTGYCLGCGAKGSYALYTVKYNSSGSQLWNVSTDPTTGDDEAYGVAVDNQNNIIITGYTSINTTNQAYYTVKYNSSGSQLWNVTTDPTSSNDEAKSVAVDSQGNVIVAGYTSLNSTNQALYMVKYNSSGSQLWNVSTDPTIGNDVASGVAVDAQGNIVVTGYCTGCGAKGLQAFYTVKYDSSGSQLWNITNDPTTGNDAASGVAVDAQGNIVITGTYSYYTVKYTEVGLNPQSYANLSQGQSWNVSWLVNATGASGSSYYVDALFNSSYANIQGNDTSDARVCLGTCQVAGPPNVTIDNVSSISPVTPLAGLNVSILVNFTASHVGGVGNLNDSTALANFSKGSVSRTGGCTPNDQNSTTIYNCTVQLTYYDAAGSWSVNVSVSDVNGSQASNGTTSFTYNTLVDINLSITNYNFGTLAAGSGWTAGQSNPILVDNRGNVNLTLNLTAYALANGSRLIGAGNMTVNVSNAVGTPLINDTPITIPNSTLVPDTDAGETNRSLYLYISVPSATPAGNFTSQSNWVVTTYG